jgi:hypothetical protein
MRRKLTFAVLGLALASAALISGARPAQASSHCVNYYCPDGVTVYETCCFLGGSETPFYCSMEVGCV